MKALRITLVTAVLAASPAALATPSHVDADMRAHPATQPPARLSLTAPVDASRGLEIACIAALIALAAGQLRWSSPAARKPGLR